MPLSNASTHTCLQAAPSPRPLPRTAAAGVVPFGEIAQRCERGAYDSPDALRADAVAAAAAVQASVQEREEQAAAEQRRRRQQQGPGSPGSRCAWKAGGPACMTGMWR